MTSALEAMHGIYIGVDFDICEQERECELFYKERIRV